mgnify:CR=1 FL=1
MTPLKSYIKELSVDEFEVCNISKTLQLRDYQEKAISEAELVLILLDASPGLK